MLNDEVIQCVACVVATILERQMQNNDAHALTHTWIDEMFPTVSVVVPC